jgi:hypothetical protein
MNTVTDKFLVCIELATELGGVLMDQVTFKYLDFMFLTSEGREEFCNRIRNMVLCTVVSAQPDLATVKLFE